MQLGIWERIGEEKIMEGGFVTWRGVRERRRRKRF